MYWFSYGLLTLVLVAFALVFLGRLFTPQRRAEAFPRIAAPNDAQRRHIAYAGTASAHLLPNSSGPGIVAAIASSLLFPALLLVVTLVLTAYAYTATASIGILYLIAPIVYTIALIFIGKDRRFK